MLHKSKAQRFLNRKMILYFHVALYTVLILMYCLALVSAINYSGNTQVPRSVFQALAIERINFSILWGLAVIVHLSIVFGWDWRQQNHMRQVNRNIKLDNENRVITRLVDQNSENHAITSMSDVEAFYVENEK